MEYDYEFELKSVAEQLKPRAEFLFSCSGCGKVFGSTSGGQLPHVRVETHGPTTRNYCDCGRLLSTLTSFDA